VIAEAVEADFEAGTAVTDAAGFLCKWTDACGNGLEPAALGGTFAVSFLGSELRGGGGTAATEGAFPAPPGGIVADGMFRPGDFGAGGGAPASEAGLAVAGGGGTLATAGGLGIATLPGIPGGGIGGEFTAPGVPAPAVDDGLGTGATAPGIEGGFGGTGGAAGV
jgi:hypothetical protein